ncbi:MAG: Gfo/Idh/MocA family oxidoreductase, partial [Bacteroidota bacterium]
MKVYKGVCIGTGYFSHFQYEAWKRMENVAITAVCSRTKANAERICKQYEIHRAYDDFEEMLDMERPDFVDIITPPETHLDLCLSALHRGIPIICQKPLAPTMDNARQIAQIAAKTGIRIMVHENFRFQPWHRELKKLLDQGIVGDVLHSINLRMRMGDGWQEDAYMDRQPYFREMEQLLVYETGIHFIDTFRYLVGEIDSVYAKLRTLNPNIKGEDFAWVHFNFKNGSLGFLDANRYNENTAEDPRLTFGAVWLEGNQGTIRLDDEGVITIQPLGEPERIHTYSFQKIHFA